MVRDEEFRQAVRELHNAYQDFDNADPDYIEVANARITAARLKVDALLRSRKNRREEVI